MRRLQVMFVLAVAFASGCTSATGVDQSLAPTSPDVVGTFSLVSANGQKLPVVQFRTNSDEWALSSDKLDIAGDDTFIETLSYRLTSLTAGTQTNQETIVTGTYSITDGRIRFTMRTGGTASFVGSVSGHDLSVVADGKRSLYVR